MRICSRHREGISKWEMVRVAKRLRWWCGEVSGGMWVLHDSQLGADEWELAKEEVEKSLDTKGFLVTIKGLILLACSIGSHTWGGRRCWLGWGRPRASRSWLRGRGHLTSAKFAGEEHMSFLKPTSKCPLWKPWWDPCALPPMPGSD